MAHFYTSGIKLPVLIHFVLPAHLTRSPLLLNKKYPLAFLGVPFPCRLLFSPHSSSHSSLSLHSLFSSLFFLGVVVFPAFALFLFLVGVVVRGHAYTPARTC